MEKLREFMQKEKKVVNGPTTRNMARHPNAAAARLPKSVVPVLLGLFLFLYCLAISPDRTILILSVYSEKIHT
jgi:hypothetical protein